MYLATNSFIGVLVSAILSGGCTSLNLNDRAAKETSTDGAVICAALESLGASQKDIVVDDEPLSMNPWNAIPLPWRQGETVTIPSRTASDRVITREFLDRLNARNDGSAPLPRLPCGVASTTFRGGTTPAQSLSGADASSPATTYIEISLPAYNGSNEALVFAHVARGPRSADLWFIGLVRDGATWKVAWKEITISA